MKSVGCLLAIVLGLAVAGCATSFSPQRVRSEIAAQTGADPQYVFEIQLGRVTMRTIRTVLAGGTGSLPLAGLTGFDLAFYDVPAPSPQGASLDFTRMAIRGWEPVVRGTLSPELPRALGDTFQSRGPEGLRDERVREVIRQP